MKKKLDITSTMPKKEFSGTYEVRTFNDVPKLVIKLSELCPDPVLAKTGLTELIINAIEHGNLGLNLIEKGDLLRNNMYLNEIERRLSLPENIEKFVKINVTSTQNDIHFRITDCGNGFSWVNYIDFDPTRLRELNGRGIAFSKAVVFQHMEYIEPGNIVIGKFEWPI